jgi:hypothetical protein
LADADLLLQIAEELEYAPGLIAEGFVVKTNHGPEYPRISAKVVAKRYRLKYG